MKTLERLLSAALILLLINFCTNDRPNSTPAAKQTVTAGNTMQADTTGSRITPAYLAGQWCYAYVEAGYGDDKKRDEQNITYKFKEDGSIRYQNNSNTPVEREGSYELGEGMLNILPALRFLPSEIRSVDEDRFVLGNSVTQLVFTRGACDE